MPTIYFQPRTPVQNLYYRMRLGAPQTFGPFVDVGSEVSDFTARYALMAEMHRRLHPFQFARRGDTVVHVGFDRVYFDKGQSHPLIYRSLVGELGSVLAVDPNPANTSALAKYAAEQGLAGISAVQVAAWKEAGTLEFTFDETWGPLSVADKVAEGRRDEAPENRLDGAITRAVRVPAEKLDTILQTYLPGKRVDLLSLTANGAEPEVLEGAPLLLDSNPDLRIAIALAFRHFSYGIRKTVCDGLARRGFTIAVADATHDPWNPWPFYFACALKPRPGQLEALGFEPSSWEAIESHGAAREAELRARRPVPPPPLAARIARKLSGMLTDLADALAKPRGN